MNGLYSPLGSNSLYYLLKTLKLISYLRDSNSEKLVESIWESVSRVEYNPATWRRLGEVLYEDSYRETAFYSVERGAVTRRLLIGDLGLSSAASTRATAMLGSYGVLVPSTLLPRPLGKKGGPRVKVFQTPDAEPEQVLKVVEHHRALESPKYQFAARLAQQMLEDYPSIASRREVQYIEVISFLRGKNVAQSSGDIAHLLSKELHERGIKVWR